MTREEAIARIKDHIEIHRYHERNAAKIFEALDMAIKALEQPEPCEDAVSRQAAKLKVARVIWEDGDSCYDFHDKCVDCLDDVPSAQPDCSDCIKHGGDWECDHVHCHKGESAQPDNDMIHMQKEQAYLQGWEEGRKALRKEIWEDGRDRLD